MGDKPGKPKLELKIPREELKKLRGVKQQEVRNRSGNRFKNLSPQYIATVLGGVMGILILAGIILSWFEVGKIIKSVEPKPLHFTTAAVGAFPALAKAEQEWNSGNLQAALWYFDELNNRLNREQHAGILQKIALARLQYHLIEQNYSQVLRLSQDYQAAYKENRPFVGDVYFYKAHAYYFQERHIFAVDSFDQAIRHGTRFEDEAHHYIKEIRALLNH